MNMTETLRFYLLESIFGFVEWSDYEPPEAQTWFLKLLQDYKNNSGNRIIVIPSDCMPNGAHGYLDEIKKQIYVEENAVQGTIAEELYHYQQLKDLGYLGTKAPQSVIDQIEREMIPVLQSKGYKTLEDLRRELYRRRRSTN